MKKIIYILLISLVCSWTILGQADLEVDGNGTLEKTLVVGENTTSSNHELVIADFDNNGSCLMTFDDGIRKAIMGVGDNGIEGVTGTTSPHDLQFLSGGVLGIHVESTGNVGLGTSSPGSALHVSSSGAFNIPQEVVILESAASNKPVLIFSEDGLGVDKTMGILYNGSGTGISEKLQIINDAATPIVTWANNGFMGINTETPRAAIDVNGNAAISAVPGSLIFKDPTIDSELTYAGNELTLDAVGGTSKILANRRVILDAGDDVILDAKDDIIFQVDHATKMFCNGGGDWGLNTTGQTARFHIKQNTTNLPALLIENNDNTNAWDWEILTTFLQLSYNGVTKGEYSTTGQYTTFSDRRLKENITSLKDGTLSSLLQLKPCSYFYKKDTESKYKTIGFIAQEMQELFPALVSENDNDDSDILGVKYSGISVVAVKAIQEQNLEIKTFMKEVEQNKTNESILEDSVSVLEDIEKRIAALNE